MRATATATMYFALLVVALAAAWPAAAAVNPSDLELGLQVASPASGALEPVVVRLTLANHGPTEMQLPPLLGYAAVVLYSRPAGKPVDWQPLEVPALRSEGTLYPEGGPDTLQLPAGGSLAREVALLDDGSWAWSGGAAKLLFDEPGTYLLRAVYSVGEGEEVLSNEASVTVVPYTGVDAEAYQWLRASTELPQFLYDFDVYAHQRSYRTDDLAEELLERFPTSRFAPWARLFLARCELFGRRLSATETAPPRPELAEALAQPLTQAADPRLRRQAAEVVTAAEQAMPPSG